MRSGSRTLPSGKSVNISSSRNETWLKSSLAATSGKKSSKSSRKNARNNSLKTWSYGKVNSDSEYWHNTIVIVRCRRAHNRLRWSSRSLFSNGWINVHYVGLVVGIRREVCMLPNLGPHRFHVAFGARVIDVSISNGISDTGCRMRAGLLSTSAEQITSNSIHCIVRKSKYMPCKAKYATNCPTNNRASLDFEQTQLGTADHENLLSLEESQPALQSIDEVAGTLGVSTATVRNWVKSEQLNTATSGGSFRFDGVHINEARTTLASELSTAAQKPS